VISVKTVNAFGQLGEVDLRSVARDVTAGFETLYTLQARARRKSYCIRQISIRHPPVLMQLDEDIQVDPIKLRDAVQSISSIRPVAPSAGSASIGQAAS
jgi:hypothetical protein